MVSKLEMPNLRWSTVEEGVQRLRETGVWIGHLRPTNLHRKTQGTSFHHNCEK